MRITSDIAAPVLDELNRIKNKNGGTLSELVNDVLEQVLRTRRAGAAAQEFEWLSQSMRARVDLDDKDAVRSLLEDDRRQAPREL